MLHLQWWDWISGKRPTGGFICACVRSLCTFSKCWHKVGAVHFKKEMLHNNSLTVSVIHLSAWHIHLAFSKFTNVTTYLLSRSSAEAHIVLALLLPDWRVLLQNTFYMIWKCDLIWLIASNLIHLSLILQSGSLSSIKPKIFILINKLIFFLIRHPSSINWNVDKNKTILDA